MERFPDMRQMWKDVLLRDAHARREVFGRRRPFQQDVDDHLTHRLRHGRSPLVDPITPVALRWWHVCGSPPLAAVHKCPEQRVHRPFRQTHDHIVLHHH
jgi:hypothetical protein